MALFVLIVVGIVVAQTWIDFRDVNKEWIVPEWAKGVALAGVVAVTLAGASSFASTWLQEAATQSDGSSLPGLFWPEIGFLLAVMAIIIGAMPKNRLRVGLVFGGLLTAIAIFCVRF